MDYVASALQLWPPLPSKWQIPFDPNGFRVDGAANLYFRVFKCASLFVYVFVLFAARGSDI
jgi:hypothetical protein